MNHYKKLKNQPLKFVLAEFRFSPVMQIAEYIPKIQEALRETYPIFDKNPRQEIRWQPTRIELSNFDQWTFITADKKSAISIDQGRLYYVTTNYSRFPDFSAACKQALEILAEIVKPNLILRIGLRYGDLITTTADETIEKLVSNHFAYSGCIEELGELQQQQTETILTTNLGTLVIRTLYGKHDLAHLPDLHGLPIAIDNDKSSNERIILDFDHIWDAKAIAVNFASSDILAKLAILHEDSRKAFWEITTDYARNQKWS